MSTRIAINGFGRIGRLVFRALVEQGLLGKDVEVVAVSDIVPADNLAYLLKYDSTQGKFDGKVSIEEVRRRHGRGRHAGRQRPRDQVPGRQGRPAGAAVEGARRRLRDRVAPACSPRPRRPRATSPPARRRSSSPPRRKGEDITVVMGVNHEKYDAGEAPHHLQRELHDELPRAGRPRAAEGRLRHRRRADDDGPQLHRDAEDRGRPVARRTGRAAAAPAINIIPSHDRRGQGRRPGDAPR